MESAKSWYQRWWVWLLIVLLVPISLTVLGIWYVLKSNSFSPLSKVLYTILIGLLGGIATFGVYTAGSQSPSTESQTATTSSPEIQGPNDGVEKDTSPQTSSREERTQAQKKKSERSSSSGKHHQSSKPGDSSPKEEQTEEVKKPANKQGRKATVVSVVDGDTYKVRFSDGTNDTVRMLGVDTPETFNENKRREYGAITDVTCLTRWGKKATAYVERHLQGKRVTLTFDTQAGQRGSYGRLLVYTNIDGTLFGKNLLRNGYARVYTDEVFAQKSTFLALQNQARANEVGLWSCGSGGSDSSQPEENPTSKPQENAQSQDTADTDYSQYTCDTNAYNCSDFSNHDVIQGIYEHCGGPKTDIHHLDDDDDGVACETLQ